METRSIVWHYRHRALRGELSVMPVPGDVIRFAPGLIDEGGDEWPAGTFRVTHRSIDVPPSDVLHVSISYIGGAG